MAKRLKFTTPTEVRRTVNRVANMILNNQIDPKQGNAILYACNLVLSAIRVDDQQKKIDELEKLVMEQQNK